MNPHICFVALKAFPVLSGRPGAEHIGGAEVQQAHIARALVERGYRVSFVTLDVGQSGDENLNGVVAYRAYVVSSGLPGIRFFHPRLTGVWKAMGRADADIYYQRTSDPLTGVVAAFCRRRGKRFIFSVGHDADCDPALSACPSFRERVLYRYGLVRADAVVAQTLTQQRALQNHFDVRSIVIPSCAVLPRMRAKTVKQDRPVLIWLGRFAPQKRLELLLDVASRCENVDFHVLGEGRPWDYVDGLKARARKLPNVKMVGYVPHAQLALHYDRATALICTSRAEGFPNTFLEAWSRRMPVITSFDPDGIVARYQLGIVGEDAETLSEAVRTVCFDEEARNRMSGSALEYFMTHHTVPAAVDAYDRLIRGLMASSSPPLGQPKPTPAGTHTH